VGAYDGPGGGMRLSAKLCAVGGIGAAWYEYSVFTNCELSACPIPMGMLRAGAAESSMRPAASLPGAASVMPRGGWLARRQLVSLVGREELYRLRTSIST
jgi:hypothetical protein